MSDNNERVEANGTQFIDKVTLITVADPGNMLNLHDTLNAKLTCGWCLHSVRNSNIITTSMMVITRCGDTVQDRREAEWGEAWEVPWEEGTQSDLSSQEGVARARATTLPVINSHTTPPHCRTTIRLPAISSLI